MYNDGLVGNQRFTGVGNITPTGQALRIYYINAHSTVSSANLTLYNTTLNSGSSGALVYLTLPSDSQGFINEQWDAGVYFPSGAWLNTGCAGTITTIIGYNTVKA